MARQDIKMSQKLARTRFSGRNTPPHRIPTLHCCLLTLWLRGISPIQISTWTGCPGSILFWFTCVAWRRQVEVLWSGWWGGGSGCFLHKLPYPASASGKHTKWQERALKMNVLAIRPWTAFEFCGVLPLNLLNVFNISGVMLDSGIKLILIFSPE